MKPTKIPEALYAQVFEVKRRKSEDRKIRIIEAVIDCVATRGLEETTFEVIGKMVKMERTHVNYYFANRKELIKTAVRYTIAVGQQITVKQVKAARTWKDRLRAVIEGPFDWLEQYPKHAPMVALFYYLCTYDEEFRQMQDLIQNAGEQRLAGTLEALVESGKLTTPQATDLARAVQSLMSGNLHYFHATNYPLSMKQLKARTVQVGIDLVEAALRDK